MASRGAYVANTHCQLQNLIKRDPVSYKDEFMQQWRHYEASLAIFHLRPSTTDNGVSPHNSGETAFGDLVTFVAHVAQCYPEATKIFPDQIMDLLSQHHAVISPNLRKTLVQALMLLRGKKLVPSINVLALFFKLFKCRDKSLRELLQSYIVSDVKAANSAGHCDQKLNRTLQNFMYSMIKDPCDTTGRKSLDVVIELYRKNIWNDDKTVNVVAEACFSSFPKVYVTALRFFMGDFGSNADDENDSDSEDLRGLQHAVHVAGKSRSRATKMKKVLAAVKKKEKKSAKMNLSDAVALQLLNDPQGFADKLFNNLKQSHERFDIRLLMLQVLSRCIAAHELLVLPYYSYCQKYLQPHQRDVTKVLVCLAQASHALVPPDVVAPIIRTIADQFVTDRCSDEVICVGLNSIREIAARCPLAMDATLLSDLTRYKSHRTKGVAIASRGLLTLFREIYPELLHRRERGRVSSDNKASVPIYGVKPVATSVPGAEMLDVEVSDEENQWEETSNEEDSDEEGWINVSSGEDISVSMTDSETSSSTESEKSDLDDVEHDCVDKKSEPSCNKIPIEQRRILTPMDFARIKELRRAKLVEDLTSAKNKRKAEESDSKIVSEDEEGNAFLDESAIIGRMKRARQNYEERMASIQEGREGRTKYGSKKGQKERASTTNREKAKKKNYLMIAHKSSVKAKAKMSLREKQILLRAHIKKQKMKNGK